MLPFYRAYRAAVRAKVEGMKLAEPEVPEAEKSARAAQGPRLAGCLPCPSWKQPSGRPCLVLLGGLPGSGKSTLARRLGEAGGLRGDSIGRGPQRARGREWTRQNRREAGEDIYTRGVERSDLCKSACAEPRRFCSKAAAC